MKDKKIPMRRCIGCMESKEKKQLVRIAGYEGNITVDLTGSAKGSGAYLCKSNSACWDKAYKKKSLERSLGMVVSEEQKRDIFDKLTKLNEE